MHRPATILLAALALLWLGASNPVHRPPAGPPGEARASLSEDRTFHVFLLVGGINMEGRGELSRSDEQPIDGAMIWDPVRKLWVQARAPFRWFSPFMSERNREGRQWRRLGCGPSFVKAYMKANPGVRVGVICAPRNHMTVENWEPGRRPVPLFDTVVRATREAMAHEQESSWSQGLKPVLKGILWHDGEPHWHRELDDYFEAFPRIVRGLRRELAGGEPLPVVFGQLVPFKPYFAPFNGRLLEQAETIPNSACVTTEGLTGRGNTFDADGYRALGRRYAAAVLELLQPTDGEAAPKKGG